MNTSGKSDVVEAVVELLVLSALQDRGATNSTWIVKTLQQQTGGLSLIEEHSIRIALRKLETSGWIRKTATPARQSERWQLTTSANKCFPIEVRKWRGFIKSWPLIANLLEDALEE